MNNRLKSKIKSRNRKARYSAIDEYVEIADKEAISILLYIAKGLKRSALKYYDFADQVYAQKALIRTRSQEGIVFLKSFFEETIQISKRPPIMDISLFIPPPKLCTDNAAYIASCAYFNNNPLNWDQLVSNPQLSIMGEI